MNGLLRRLLVPFLVMLVDCLVVFDAFSLAYLLRFVLQVGPGYYPPAPPVEYFKAMVVVAYFWLLLFKLYGLYDFARARSNIDTVYLVVRAISFGTLIILSLSFFYREITFSRLVCIYAWCIALVLFAAFRLALGRLRSELQRRGKNTRRVLLIGSRSLAVFLATKIEECPELGYRVVGTLDDERPKSRLPCEYLGSIGDLERVVQEQSVDLVFLAHPVIGHLRLLKVIEACEGLGLPLSMVPPTYDLMINFSDFEEVDGLPLVAINEQQACRWYEIRKRVLDLVLASVATVLLAPLWVVVALCIRLEDGGPAIFSQRRVGKDGRVFKMLKFRTMVVNAEAMLPQLVNLADLSEPVFKLENDPRVTRVGRFLRRTSLDELPQLVNVLRGEMSIVGPRPEEQQVVERYGIAERRRLKAKPGITGLQQVECRGVANLRARLRYDILYLRKRTILLDLWIILKTCFVVASGRGAK